MDTMNEELLKQQLEDIRNCLETHTGLTRYLQLRIETQSLEISSIRAQQVTDQTAPPHVDVYVGDLQPDLVLRWFRANMERVVRSSIQMSEMRALCKYSHLIPLFCRTHLTNKMQKKYKGQESSWVDNPQAISYLYANMLEVCKTTAICPFCGSHEAMEGTSLIKLECLKCKATWHAKNPLKANWKK